MICPRCHRAHSGLCGIPRRTGVRIVPAPYRGRRLESLSGGGRIRRGSGLEVSYGSRRKGLDCMGQTSSLHKVSGRLATSRPGVAAGRTGRPQARQRNLLQEAQASERRLLRELREGHLDRETMEAFDSVTRMARQLRGGR